MKKWKRIDLILTFTSLIKSFHGQIYRSVNCVIVSYSPSLTDKISKVHMWLVLYLIERDMWHLMFYVMVKTCWFTQTSESRCPFLMKTPHHTLPLNIADGWKVDVVYLTRCIGFWWRGIGGSAVLFSSLSFPQHLHKWLQLLTDDCCNRLVSVREKARLCPQNVIGSLREVWALLIKQLG